MIHFGTGGFRGVIGDDFTKENVKRIAQAISDVIHEDNSKKPVVIGYDFRFGSDAFAIYRANTLAANNIPVILASGPTPTPAVRAVSKAMDNDFGIRITASHNPYYFNGVKLFQGQGMDAEVSLTDKVENKVQALKEYKTRNYEDALKEGKIVKKDILTPFLENIRNFPSIGSPAISSMIFEDTTSTLESSLTSYIKQKRLTNASILTSLCVVLW